MLGLTSPRNIKERGIKMNGNQAVENLDAIRLYQQAMDERNNQVVKTERLRYCTAEVDTTENFYILRSYKTIVAAIDRRNNRGADVLRYVYGYTATSAQHIRKFFADYGAETVDTYRH